MLLAQTTESTNSNEPSPLWPINLSRNKFNLDSCPLIRTSGINFQFISSADFRHFYLTRAWRVNKNVLFELLKWITLHSWIASFFVESFWYSNLWNPFYILFPYFLVFSFIPKCITIPISRSKYGWSSFLCSFASTITLSYSYNNRYMDCLLVRENKYGYPVNIWSW